MPHHTSLSQTRLSLISGIGTSIRFGLLLLFLLFLLFLLLTLLLLHFLVRGQIANLLVGQIGDHLTEVDVVPRGRADAGPVTPSANLRAGARALCADDGIARGIGANLKRALAVAVEAARGTLSKADDAFVAARRVYSPRVVDGVAAQLGRRGRGGGRCFGGAGVRVGRGRVGGRRDGGAWGDAAAVARRDGRGDAATR